MSSKDPFLLGLFREEMAAHSAVLTDGLLALEREGGAIDSHQTEPLMRAAHSLKGAARVVELSEVSRVAHRMEDVFVAMGQGRIASNAELTDLLLAVLDWMVSVADVPDAEMDDWLLAHASEADAWEARLGGWLEGAVEPPSVPGAIDAPEERLSTAEIGRQASGQSQDVRESPRDQDASVRISADNLGQMLAHSADLLLEARRLDALARNARLVTRRIRGLGTSGEESLGAIQAQGVWSEVGDVLEAQDDDLQELSSRLNHLSERLHALVLRGRLRPFSEGVQGFPRWVRDLARDLGKSIEFRILGGATLIDRDILNRLDAPLNHLVRNAIDHGIEQPDQRALLGKPPEGQVRMEARHLNGRLLITLSDDGRGIDVTRLREKIIERGLVTREMAEQLLDQELYAFLFLPGLTTSETVTEISGRGVGLDVVQSMVHGCGGSLQVFSEKGLGTRFECQLPITRSVIRCLRVEVGHETYALPLSWIDRAERVKRLDLNDVPKDSFFAGKWAEVPLVSMRNLMEMSLSTTEESECSLVLLGGEDRRYGLMVDRLLGEVDLVVRPLDSRLGKIPLFSAASIDPEGCPLLILDSDALLDRFDREAGRTSTSTVILDVRSATESSRILVVDDSLTVREVERKLLEEAGYTVETAVDGMDGWNQLNLMVFDLVVTDVDMPRMNGIELVSRIRADERFEALPVVIVSYKDREEDRQLGLKAGANAYLTKGGFQDDGLLSLVRQYLNERDIS